MSMLRVLLVEQHTLVAEGMRVVLDMEPNIEVVGLAENGHTALDCVRLLRPNVAVMDVALPGLRWRGYDALPTRAPSAMPGCAPDDVYL